MINVDLILDDVHAIRDTTLFWDEACNCTPPVVGTCMTLLEPRPNSIKPLVAWGTTSPEIGALRLRSYHPQFRSVRVLGPWKTLRR